MVLIEILRWSGSLALVLAVHSVLLALTIANQPPAPPAESAEPPAAILLELAPLAPDARPDPLSVSDLSEVIPEPDPPPPLELLPPATASVALPRPVPKPPTRTQTRTTPPEKTPERQPVDPKATPSPSSDELPAAAAPTFGLSPDRQSAALPTWKAHLLRHLERHKRYPAAAQRARTEGVTYILFTMTRDGRVLKARVERSAGNATLDREGLDLLARAEPLPSLPHDQPGETLQLVVPVQFFMRR